MALIRQADPEDAYAIASVHVVGWQYAYKGLLPEEICQKQSIKVRASWWRQFTSDRTNWPLFVADDASGIEGFASVIPARDEDVDSSKVSELAAIYLPEAASRKGLGSLLLKRCQAEARSRGCRSMLLWVLDENERAIQFYRKHGFDERQHIVLRESP